jgi:hypothetical protein
MISRTKAKPEGKKLPAQKTGGRYKIDCHRQETALSTACFRTNFSTTPKMISGLAAISGAP